MSYETFREPRRATLRDASQHSRRGKPELSAALELITSHIREYLHILPPEAGYDLSLVDTLLARYWRHKDKSLGIIPATPQPRPAGKKLSTILGQAEANQAVHNAITTSKAEVTLRDAKRISQSEAVRAALRIINGA